LSIPAPLPTETVDLIVLTGGGDRPAAEALIGLYQQRIARFVIAQTGDASHYEDLCQTIFVKMMLGLRGLRSVERFEPWLFQIARNVCRDHLRSRSGWRRIFVAFKPEHETVPAPEPQQNSFAEIERGLERLPDAQRIILQFALGGDRSYEELAELSGSSVSAVKSRLHRARQNLRAIMLAGNVE